MNSKLQVSGVMKRLPNFTISAHSVISQLFRKQGNGSFYSAIRYLEQLPTTSECSPRDLSQVIEEGGSRCAKVALLAALARENYHPNLRLVLCTYIEHFDDNPVIKGVLAGHNLPGLPFTACLLKYQDDFYSPLEGKTINPSAIQSDIEITPAQIGSFTERYCHHFIKHWLMIEKLHHAWTVDNIKQVKQECYQLLENQMWRNGNSEFKA